MNELRPLSPSVAPWRVTGRFGALLLGGACIFFAAVPTTHGADRDGFSLFGWLKGDDDSMRSRRATDVPDLTPTLPYESNPVDIRKRNKEFVPLPQGMQTQPRMATAAKTAPMTPAEAVVHFDRPGLPTMQELIARSVSLSQKGLGYRFGSNDPHSGGMDCSGTVQFLLSSMGYEGVPRTSYAQYDWLREHGKVKKVGWFHSEKKAYANLEPGDLVFWGGTYNSGHKVSHVMIYLGRHPKTGRPCVFGARGEKMRGYNGAGVDIFELGHGGSGKLVGYGRIPGLKN